MYEGNSFVDTPITYYILHTHIKVVDTKWETMTNLLGVVDDYA